VAFPIISHLLLGSPRADVSATAHAATATHLPTSASPHWHYWGDVTGSSDPLDS